MLFVKKKVDATPGRPEPTLHPTPNRPEVLTGLMVMRKPPSVPAPADVLDIEFTEPPARSSAPNPADTLAALGAPAAPPVKNTGQPSLPPSRKFFGLFGNGKPKRTTAPQRRGNVATTAPAVESKAGLPVKKPKKGAPIDGLQIVVDLENGRRTYWRLTRSGLIPQEQPDGGMTASFSSRDRRFVAASPLSAKAAQDLALSEVGEPSAILNLSRQYRSVFATTRTRLAEFKHPVGPGQMLLELLMAAREGGTADCVAGFLLGNPDSGQSLALLFKWAPGSGASGLQVAVNPDNLRFTLEQFADVNLLDASSAVLFREKELLDVAGQLQPYPAAGLWLGVPTSRLSYMAAAASIAFAAGSGGALVTQYTRYTHAEAALASRQAQLAVLQQHEKQLVGQHLLLFGKTLALNTDQVFDRATALWSPGSQVRVDADAQKQSFDVTLPVSMPTLGGALQASSPGEVAKLLRLAAPAGCRRKPLKISGTLNAIQAHFTCQSPSNPLSRYW